MHFTEYELTAALTGSAKQVLAAQRRDVRRGRVDIEDAWDQMDRYARFTVLDAVGGQLLPVLGALPDVEVIPGTRPAFTDQQIATAVEQCLEESGGRLRRKATVLARTAMVRTALLHVPPRRSPETTTGPSSP